MKPSALTAARYAVLGLMGGDSGCAQALTLADWENVALLARMHRVEPMLHHQTRGAAGIPDQLARKWQAAYRKAALRSLSLQKMLLAAAKVLNDQSMPWLALKGSWLAWHIYDHPALRPMRDIDLLVEEQSVIAAYDALLANGFERMAAHATPIAIALAEHKHLPPLRHQATGLTLELHHRMLYEPVPGQPFADSAPLFKRASRKPLAGQDIPLPDPTDSMLHFIIHCAHDHDLDNGPLVLCDLAEGARAPVDWDRFWAMAAEGGWMQGARLLIALTRRHIAGASSRIPAPPGDAVADIVLDAAAQMLLPDRRAALSQSLGVESDARGKGWLGRVALLRRLFPARHVVAAAARVPDDSIWVWRHYPVWLTQKLSSLTHVDRAQVEIDVALTREVRHWLDHHGR